MRRTRWLWPLLVTVPVAIVAGQAPPPSPPPPSPAAASVDPVDLAHDLSMLATGLAASDADLHTLAAAGYSRDAYAHFIHELVRRPQIVNVAARVLRIAGSPMRMLLARAVLKQQAAGTKSIYYVHEPCDPSTAVAVKPWWDLGTKVWVCPDAYRPKVFRAPDGNYCSGVYAGPGQPASPCGCGPNLIRCLRNEDDRAAYTKAILAEAKGTIGWVIEHDLPLQVLFSSQESFRGPLAELLYQNWKIENRDVPSLESLPDWRKWPKDGTWAPRPQSRPGEHAGLFTTHYLPQAGDSQRLKVSIYLDMLWCQSQDSLRVQTKQVLEVAQQVGGNLRSHVGWQELAARPLCTSCHARIDYGVQFLAGFQWHMKALHYVADEQRDDAGPLYLRDIDDQRGVAKKRNPQEFMRIVLAQPEFTACMAKDFETHAFASPADPDLQDLDATLRAIVARKGTYRELLETTLGRYLDRRLAGRAPPPPPPPSTADERTRAVATMIESQCSNCHDPGDANPPGFILAHERSWCAEAGRDCARVAVQILNAVAFDRMPKDQPLGSADKRRYFDLLAPLAWSDPRTRDLARRYFIDAPQGPPLHAIDVVLGWIKASGTQPAPAIDVPRPTSVPTFSTTAAAQAAIVAAKVCGAQPDPQACIDKAMDEHAITK